MKDPACLFYIDTWLSATAEMDSDVRGWYLNLILHQYDKKDLPNDLEKLAVLAGVKFSEFERFKQMFEQVLKHKFELNESNRLENNYAKSILTNREQFKDKRQKSGNIGVVIKLAKTLDGFNSHYIERLKNDLFLLEVCDIEKHKDKQVLEQVLKLYINENKNINKDIVINNDNVKEMANFNFCNELLNSQSWLESLAMNNQKKFNLTQVKEKLNKFTTELNLKFDFKQNKTEFSSHFVSWLNKQENTKVKPYLDSPY
jgi:hypothetical protein